MGVLPNGWIIRENPIKIDDNWGYPHDLGNPYICSFLKDLCPSMGLKIRQPRSVHYFVAILNSEEHGDSRFDSPSNFKGYPPFPNLPKKTTKSTVF